MKQQHLDPPSIKDLEGDMPEDVLVSRMKAGETQAYKYFFWGYYDYIQLLAMSLLEDKSRIKGIVSDVLYDAWVHRNSPELRAPLRLYLYEAVLRKCQPLMEQRQKRSFLGRIFSTRRPRNTRSDRI